MLTSADGSPMSTDGSHEVSRENSSSDLLNKGKEKKKNVRFNHTAQEGVSSDLTVDSRGSSQLSEVGVNQELLEPPLSTNTRRRTKNLLTPSDERQGSLFFLEEDDDDATDVPITPFKKTGKIKLAPSSRIQASPDIRPLPSSNDAARALNPFVSDGPEVTVPRIAERREGHVDIPMIRLPSTGLEYSNPASFGGSSGPGKAPSTPGTPGTPGDGMVGLFGNSHDGSLNDGRDELASNTNLNSLFTRDAGENEPLSSEMTEEHRKMNLEAYKLVRAHTIQTDRFNKNVKPAASADTSRRNSFMSTVGSESDTIVRDQLEVLDESVQQKKHSSRGGVLSNLMQLYNSTVYQQQPATRNQNSGSASGTSTPKWHQRHSQSNASLTALLTAGQSLGSVAGLGSHSRNSSAVSLEELGKSQRPTLAKMRKHSGGLVGAVRQSFYQNRSRLDAELRITMAIADVLQRQKFIIKLCRSLMLYGAPTHRLEDYLKLTSRALEIDAQFLYIPGCMIVAFDDKGSHTTDVKIVRVVQGTDLGKLNEVHRIYKNVLHAVIDVEQGILELDQQLDMPQLYRLGFVLFAYGLAAVCVGPFAFQSSFIDLPIQFFLGLVVGVLQLVVAPRSQLYANVFEILATICVSFLGRGFGSIPKKVGGGTIFCFAALTQSSIALILPGYMVLCGALELQSKSIVAGSVRLFYAIVYSLFLSFGITIGSVLYGWMDSHATQATTCTSDISDWYRFLFVPGFATCLLVVNQAKPRQAPVALFIASAGYATNYFTNKRFGVAQVSNAIGAFVIGCLGNLYSRVGHGLAFTAVLPSIFVQVPSGLASGSSLVSGLQLANSILNNTANSTLASSSSSSTSTTSDTGALQFGYEMIQIAIGITVGLFASALVIYIPLCGAGKRTGMLTF